MRLLFLAAVFAVCSCSGGQPTAPRQLTPKPRDLIQVALLPGDVVSWVQNTRPPLEVDLYGLAPEQVGAAIEGLRWGTSLVSAKGEKIAVDVEALEPTLLPNTSARTPAGIQLRPQKPLANGWYQLRVDPTKLPALQPAPWNYVESGRLIGRFNVASAPTVQRLWVCPALGALKLRFSEPVIAKAALKEALALTDTSGQPLDCMNRFKSLTLDAERETVTLLCVDPLPSQLGVAFAPGALLSEGGGLPVTDLAGKPFSLSLDTEGLGTDGDPSGDCRVWVPPSPKP